MKGPLSEGALPGLLKDIYVGRKTGLLNFVRGWERRSVRFIGGSIVHGDTNVTGAHLGETMVLHGLLRQQDLDRASNVVTQTGKRLGLVLRELDIVDRDRLEDAVAIHVREMLLKVFAWTDGHYDFEEQDAAEFMQYDLTLKLSTGEMILEAVRSVHDLDVVRYALGDIDRILILSTDPLLRFQRINLTPVDGFVLSRVDGALTAREVLKMTFLRAEEAQRSLLGLLCTGIVEYVTRPRKEDASAEAVRREILELHAKLRALDHFKVLGLERECSEADVKAAYSRLARRYHPDVHHQPVLSDVRTEIEAVFARISAAHKVLSDPQTRAVYEGSLLVAGLGPGPEPGERAPETSAPDDPAARAARVEEALREAEQTFGEGKYWDAIRLAEEAAQLGRGRLRQQARVVLARCYLKNPNWRKRAEEELVGAIREDAENPEAYFLLGTIYKEAQLPGRAAAMFRKTLELRPRHVAAQAELDSIGAGARADDGFLKKILG